MEILFESNRVRNEDRKKGQSILALPDEYVVLDLETTGFDPYWDEIIEVCCIHCFDNKPIETFTTLVKPQNPISDFITNLTGITNDMVATAPSIKEVLPGLNSFIGDYIILGHCVYFDINFIHDAYIYEFGNEKFSITNDSIDLLRLARRFMPGLENYKLSTIASNIGLDITGAHRSEFDCNITHLSYQKCKEIANIHPDKDKLLKRRFQTTTFKASDIKRNSSEIDVSHPFYNMTCVFTGKLERFVRKEAMQVIVDIGGFCGDGVTRDTNFLILGDYDYCKSIKDGKSSKYKKAEKLKSEGQEIEIISESVFYDMILEHQ